LAIGYGQALGMAASSAAYRLTGARRPLNIMIAVTDRCTGHCAYCRIPERRSAEMNTAEVTRLLDEATSLGCRRVGLWGGEPLLREDLGEIVRRAKGLGLFVTIDTNGHLLPERDDAVRAADHLNVSLDGDREAHDRLRGAGNFERTMRGIEHLAGRHRFWTLTVLHRDNLGAVDWVLDTARRMGFLASFQPLHHNDSLGRSDGYRPDDHDFRAVVRLLLARQREGAPIASSRKYLERLADWPDYLRTRETRPGRECLAGRLYLNVDVNGDLYPCSLLVGEAAAPNARELGFARAFAQLKPAACSACQAACFTEYNLLYGLDPATGWHWWRALRR
jgi:MoaA/NifB/PqqE/SkfB family radical SAM enzyme